MRLTSAVLMLVTTISACTAEDDGVDEELGDIGDGKSDSFGVVDRAFTVSAGKSRRFSFTANASFTVTVTQPTTDEPDRSPLTLSLKKPDSTRATAAAANEPSLLIDLAVDGSYSLTVKNVGDKPVNGLLNVRPLGGFDGMPNPNAPMPPEAAWQPPAVEMWPSSYVVFNNTGCGHDCTQTDSSALAPRSVMIKMLVTAIKSVKQGGVVRVSNFNISSSASVKPVLDALLWAIAERAATVKVVMDEAQNNPTSRTTLLSQQGAQVRFLNGLTFTNSVGPAVGIMHSKIVAVDDEVVLTGSNNFSSTGFITNEENSVVLRGAANADRIRSFLCDVDVMFDAGVEAGQPQRTDADRKDAVAKLDACNGPDTWFPPSGVIATGQSITLANVVKAISSARSSVYLAPDMMAHPGLVSALISRGKQAKADGTPFSVKLVLDASDEALHNPAFGDCLEAAATKYGLDFQVKYWPGTATIFQLMHHKFMLVDSDEPGAGALYNGSANYSAKALKNSFENVTRYGAASYRPLVDAFGARFQQLFAQAKDKATLATEDGLEIPTCPLSI